MNRNEKNRKNNDEKGVQTNGVATGRPRRSLFAQHHNLTGVPTRRGDHRTVANDKEALHKVVLGGIVERDTSTDSGASQKKANNARADSLRPFALPAELLQQNVSGGGRVNSNLFVGDDGEISDATLTDLTGASSTVPVALADISRENERRLAGMSREEIEEAVQSLREQLPPELIAKLKNRSKHGTAASSREQTVQRNNVDDDNVSAVSGESTKATQPTLSSSRRAPPEDTNRDTTTAFKAVYEEAAARYERDKLAWMHAPDPLQEQRSDAKEKPSFEPTRNLRFSMHGELCEQDLRSAVADAGDATVAAAVDDSGVNDDSQLLTVAEWCHMAKSVVVAQRVAGLRALANIVHRGALGLHAGTEYSDATLQLLFKADVTLIFRTALDDNSVNVQEAALAGLCSLVQARADACDDRQHVDDATLLLRASQVYPYTIFPLWRDVANDFTRLAHGDADDDDSVHEGDWARVDVGACLVAMRVSHRIRYMLEMLDTPTHATVLALRFIRSLLLHSGALAAQVASTPHLLATLLSIAVNARRALDAQLLSAQCIHLIACTAFAENFNVLVDLLPPIADLARCGGVGGGAQTDERRTQKYARMPTLVRAELLRCWHAVALHSRYFLLSPIDAAQCVFVVQSALREHQFGDADELDAIEVCRALLALGEAGAQALGDAARFADEVVVESGSAAERDRARQEVLPLVRALADLCVEQAAVAVDAELSALLHLACALPAAQRQLSTLLGVADDGHCERRLAECVGRVDQRALPDACRDACDRWRQWQIRRGKRAKAAASFVIGNIGYFFGDRVDAERGGDTLFVLAALVVTERVGALARAYRSVSLIPNTLIAQCSSILLDFCVELGSGRHRSDALSDAPLLYAARPLSAALFWFHKIDANEKLRLRAACVLPSLMLPSDESVVRTLLETLVLPSDVRQGDTLHVCAPFLCERLDASLSNLDANRSLYLPLESDGALRAQRDVALPLEPHWLVSEAVRCARQRAGVRTCLRLLARFNELDEARCIPHVSSHAVVDSLLSVYIHCSALLDDNEQLGAVWQRCAARHMNAILDEEARQFDSEGNEQRVLRLTVPLFGALHEFVANGNAGAVVGRSVLAPALANDVPGFRQYKRLVWSEFASMGALCAHLWPESSEVARRLFSVADESASLLNDDAAVFEEAMLRAAHILYAHNRCLYWCAAFHIGGAVARLKEDASDADMHFVRAQLFRIADRSRVDEALLDVCALLLTELPSDIDEIGDWSHFTLDRLRELAALNGSHAATLLRVLRGVDLASRGDEFARRQIQSIVAALSTS